MPRSWKDLLKPVYKGKTAYDDPTWGGTSYTLVYRVKGFFRPIIPGAMPADLKSKFLPEKEYSRARALDLAKMAAASDALKKAWMEEIRGNGR